jgi:hypothetical protein
MKHHMDAYASLTRLDAGSFFKLVKTEHENKIAYDVKVAPVLDCVVSNGRAGGIAGAGSDLGPNVNSPRNSS